MADTEAGEEICRRKSVIVLSRHINAAMSAMVPPQHDAHVAVLTQRNEMNCNCDRKIKSKFPVPLTSREACSLHLFLCTL